jgi:hypothetical protein
MTELPPTAEPHDPHERWRFLRDVAVFQFKLALDNLRDFALVPISLVAAIVDLFFKGEREGALFYKVLEWGLHSEKIIDLYSVIEKGDGPGHDYTVDAVIARLEAVIVREYEKGGTAASVKTALDRTIDQIQREGGNRRQKAREAIDRAAERVRARMAREANKEANSE